MSTAAALHEIEQAAFAALAPLDSATDHSRDFALVDRYAGEITQLGASPEVMAALPACLLAFEAEDDAAGVVTISGDSEQFGRSSWRAYVATSDLRGDGPATTGSPGQAGALSLVGKVIQALNGLPIEGLRGTSALRYAGTRPALIVRGQIYAYMVRFVAERSVEQVAVEERTPPWMNVSGALAPDDGSDNEFPFGTPTGG